MKEVFRNADSARVGLYQSILNDAGIETFIYNTGTQQSLVGGLMVALFPLPIFFPTLAVIRDEDYDRAMALLTELQGTPVDSIRDWVCGNCGEPVPETLAECWNCQTESR
jgi:hypothetical protein